MTTERSPLDPFLAWFDKLPPGLRQIIVLDITNVFRADIPFVKSYADPEDTAGFRAALWERRSAPRQALAITAIATVVCDMVITSWGDRAHWAETVERNLKMADHFRKEGQDHLADMLGKDSSLHQAQWLRAAADWLAIRAEDGELGNKVLEAWRRVALFNVA